MKNLFAYAIMLFFRMCPGTDMAENQSHPVSGSSSSKERAARTFAALKRDETRYRNDPLCKEGWGKDRSRCFSDKKVEIWRQRPGAFYL
jgi:hypothetical protein